MLEDEAAPPVEPDELPVPPPLDDEEPIPLELGAVELELDEPLGELGADDVEDDDEPPGTTTVSFSFVVELVLLEPLGALPPGMTVVVSLRSQADSAKAPIRTNT